MLYRSTIALLSITVLACNRRHVGRQSGKAHPSTSFWRWDDRSSETVWWGDDRSHDRHFVPLIDHRKQFGGEMIALMTGTYFRWSIIGKINRFAVHKSDHLPVKTFPMIDHLTAKLFPMIAQMNFKPFPMIDHRKRFDGEMSDHLPVKTMSAAELYPTVLIILHVFKLVSVYLNIMSNTKLYL